MKLTRRQKEILDFIKAFIKEEGYSPSMEEIATHFHFASLNAVYKHLLALEARGHLHRDANRARSIEISRPDTPPPQTLPLLGYVAAGLPIEAIATPETVTVPDELLPGPGKYYVLQVKGDSMIDEHIEDGDYVVIDSKAPGENGTKVVALVDGESATLKKLYREGSHIRLQAANPSVPDLVLDGDRVGIQGVLVAVMRRYR